MTNLQVNGTLISDGQDNVKVNLATVQKVTCNGVDVYERVSIVPDPIDDFSASNNNTDGITCTWTVGNDTDIVHLVNIDTQTIIESDITSGYIWTTCETGIVYNLAVLAEKIDNGKILSNINQGKMIVIN